MREDMSRVIVERPRLGGGRTRKGRARAPDDLPKQEGMRRPHLRSGDWKTLNENLAPLRRYLERQAGRPWDKVYSEIARHLRVDNTVQQHVRDHLSDFVAVKPRRRSGKAYLAGGGNARRDRLWYQPLYVDPKDGLLKRTDRLPEAKALRRARRHEPKSPDRIALAGDRELAPDRQPLVRGDAGSATGAGVPRVRRGAKGGAEALRPDKPRDRGRDQSAPARDLGRQGRRERRRRVGRAGHR
jgi:hypothetical protein